MGGFSKIYNVIYNKTNFVAKEMDLNFEFISDIIK